MTQKIHSLSERAEKALASRKYAEAESLYRQLVDDLSASLGSNHLEIAIVLHQLATVLEEQERPDEAFAFRKRASQILQRLNS